MSDGTTLLFALPGYRVLDVAMDVDGGRVVLIESVQTEGGCPACGVLSALVKERPTCRVKDLPYGLVPLRVWVRKRRLLCAEPLCPRRSFTQTCPQLPARSRLTGRLRVKVATAVTATNRAMSEVAAEHDLAWGTVHRILVAAAVTEVGQAAPTAMIGIDETRARSVRWLPEQAAEEAGGKDEASPPPLRWRRSNPWMTSIVDLDPTHPSGVIGLAPGRSGACVKDWLASQTPAFRAAVQVVAIDPSAPYAAAIRTELPHARIVLDHFHLVLLANTMLTDVRQRVSHEQHDRRGRKVDPAWAHRRLLLRAGDQLRPKALARLKAVLDSDDPTNQVGAAWAIKELLRQLLAGNGPSRYCRSITSHRRTAFLAACVDADMPETTRLAATVERWWPEIEGFLELGVTNECASHCTFYRGSGARGLIGLAVG